MELLRRSLQAHDIHIVIVGLFALSAFFAAQLAPAMQTEGVDRFFEAVFLFLPALTLLAITILRFLRLATVVRPDRPLKALILDVFAFFRDPVRQANGIPVFLITVILMKTFTFYKANIPNVIPFDLDTTFAEWDRMVHFGFQPWELLHAAIGYPPVTLLINVLYNFWFMVMWVVWAAFAFQDGTSNLRSRFLIAFALIWIVGGSLAATVLSSAGPAYFERLGIEPNPYEPLLAYLRDVNAWWPLWALKTQDLLWAAYEGRIDIQLGISAMPSMHNASMLLLALASWQYNKRVGIGMFAMVGIIYIGSIHLGWHYALDAYAGYAVTLVVWWLSGKIANWHESREVSRAYAQALADHRSRPDTASGRN